MIKISKYRINVINKLKLLHFHFIFRSVKAEDAGKYECQVSTEPKLSHFVHLTVIGKLFE